MEHTWLWLGITIFLPFVITTVGAALGRLLAWITASDV